MLTWHDREISCRARCDRAAQAIDPLAEFLELRVLDPIEVGVPGRALPYVGRMVLVPQFDRGDRAVSGFRRIGGALAYILDTVSFRDDVSAAWLRGPI